MAFEEEEDCNFGFCPVLQISIAVGLSSTAFIAVLFTVIVTLFLNIRILRPGEDNL